MNDNSKNEIVPIDRTDKIVKLVNENKYEILNQVISSVNVDQLISDVAGAIVRIAECQQEAFVRIYSQAIIAQVQKEARELDSTDAVLRNFNDTVEKVLTNLNYSDTVAVRNLCDMLKELRETLKVELNSINKPSLLGFLRRR